MRLLHPKDLDVARILVIQPYVPTYRIPLFRYLRRELPKHGLEFRVAAASPTGIQAAREDAVHAEEDFHIRQSHVTLGNRSIQIRRIGQVLRDYRPDMIILEQAIKNLESWQLLLKASRHRPLVGLWGQGAPYSQDPSAAVARLKSIMTKRARWFFAYTDAGAEFIASEGFSRDRITVLRNSTDTNQLRTDIQSTSEHQVREFRQTHKLTPGKTALFMGGIDSRKGLEFLIQSVERIQELEPEFRLLVAGAGSDVGKVLEATENGISLEYLGRLEGEEKALALETCDFVLTPTWVGLVATDALAAGKPIATTDHHSHAPEIAYLEDGRHRVTSEHSPSAFAAMVVCLIRDPGRLQRLQQACDSRGYQYSIESMGQRFVSGIVEWSRLDLNRD